MRYLSAADLDRALPMGDLVDAIDEAFRAHADGKVDSPPRLHLGLPAGDALVMGARVAGMGVTAKLVSLVSNNESRSLPGTHGLVVFADETTGVLRLLCDGGRLTARRTGAVCGVATRRLARPGRVRVGLVGCGAIARTQLEAVAEVREVEEVFVYGRRDARARAFIEDAEQRHRVPVRATDTPEDAVAPADVVCVATPSTTPVFDGSALSPGTHLNAVGSYRLDMRELDATTVGRASRIVADERAAARIEAGELVAAIQAGLTRPEDWLELGQALQDPGCGEWEPDGISLFKSVGLALQDVAACALAARVAEDSDLGQVLR